MSNLCKISLMLLMIVSLLFFGGCVNKTVEKIDEPIVTILKAEDNQAKFEPYLQNQEFLGYVVKSQTTQATYIYGLIYNGSDEYHIETPLQTVITLKDNEDSEPELISQATLHFNEIGGVQLETIEDTESCTAFACDGNVFIQVKESPYSEYLVLHQLLLDDKGLLSTAESTDITGDFFQAKGEKYTIWQKRWCKLNTTSNTITYDPANIEKFRPKINKDDIVIAYNYENRSPHEVTFEVNGNKITPGQDELNNTRNSPIIEAKAGSKIYFLQTKEYPMQCKLNYVLSETNNQEGDFGEISDSDFGEQGIGYASFTLSHEYTKAYLFASPFVDYAYNFTIKLK